MSAILLVNLGTPANCDPESVGVYLEEFLTDPYVIGLPGFLRNILVKKLIVPRRKFASAEKYHKIWTDRGSPLRFHSDDLLSSLKTQSPELNLKMAFRYGPNSIESALQEFKTEGVQKVFVLPLFPHYAESSVETVKQEALRSASRLGQELQFLDLFYQEDWFLRAWAELIRQQLNEFSADHILFSYHGIPISHVVRAHPDCRTTAKKQKLISCPADCSKNLCYIGQCRSTSRLIMDSLAVPGLAYSTAFQSRLGPLAWTEPNTVNWLERLYDSGVRRPLVVCPSFVSDCLETLEEIGMTERERFNERTDAELRLTPCLNSDPTWVNGLSGYLKGAL